MWDERYSSESYAYGKEPNSFLVDSAQHIPRGALLSLAEGEGRNAVYLAKLGCQVTAVDASLVGLKKAQQLAQDNQVQIECIQADLANFDLGTNRWDAIVSIFCPLPSVIRQQLYRSIQAALKPNGIFLVEAYTPAQLNYGTGGGSSADVLQTRATLSAELPGLTFLHLQELEREVREGQYHTGLGAVVQAIAQKTAAAASI